MQHIIQSYSANCAMNDATCYAIMPTCAYSAAADNDSVLGVNHSTTV